MSEMKQIIHIKISLYIQTSMPDGWFLVWDGIYMWLNFNSLCVVVLE